jgi:hypothetical protein
MWRSVTVTGVAAIAAAIVVANLVPANARPAGAGPASPHPQTVQHFATGGGIDSCNLPMCKGGSSRSIGGPAGPSLAGPHSPTTQHIAIGGWNHPCEEPTCRHHHHHDFDNNFAFFQSNGPDVYQPEPDCWRWSYRLHHWIWVCGPYYPSY